MSKITIEMSEYKDLLRQANMLLALEDAGVDNWSRV
jgi:hypothetical protein